MATYNLNFDELKKNHTTALQSQLAAEKSALDSEIDSKLKVTNDEYKRAIEQTEQSYADQYQKNAVQKLINERQIAETNANLGLTDSGLNRTQQTAAQLSYANQKGKLDIAKQQSLDEKSSALAAAVAELEQSRISGHSSIEKSYEQLANDRAQAEYETNWEAYTAEQKALIEAQQKELDRIADYNLAIEKAKIAAGSDTKQIYTFSGYDATKGKNVYYGSDGKTYYYDEGQNPYTGDYNTKVYAAEYKDSSIGFFSNGYQPKGLVSEGGKFSKAVDNNGNVLQTNITGKLQTIWKAPNGKYFVWYGDKNQYQEVEI